MSAKDFLILLGSGRLASIYLDSNSDEDLFTFLLAFDCERTGGGL
jgi:hypothetical protein